LRWCARRLPHLPTAQWREFMKAHQMNPRDDYIVDDVPVVQVPGLKAQRKPFAWRTRECHPDIELWWRGPLRYQPRDYIDREKLFATFTFKSVERQENVLELRSGGGIEFEYGAILELISILWLTNEKLS
jgi:hypothetical protein